MTIEYRDEEDDERGRDNGLQRALIGVATVAAVGGIAFLVTRKLTESSEREVISDAPDSTLRGPAGRDAPVQRTVTVNRPRQELYDFWRGFTKLPQFMDNVKSVERLDGERTRWVIKAPAGTSVILVNRTTEDVPGSVIAWESGPESSIRNSGRIEFLDAPPGRGTYVRARISYDPPAGPIGKLIAKVLQREPAVQARRDLRRFKQLMETGEVTSSASPSGRKSEEPTEQSL
ncbi:MAG TPA: SRPBCC family protein [Allosphingosinicella sp.]|uniref:SRPBCC family protein n=1 Tax=Allosphingosinicella sp. TaxID=2823234 RepID=UPI002F27E01A